MRSRPEMKQQFRGAVKRATLRDSLRKLVFILAAAFCVTPWASPFIALGLGAVLTLTICPPLRLKGQHRTELLLQLSVVLMGFDMSLPLVLRAAAVGAPLAAMTIVGTMILGFLLAKPLKIPPRESSLISAGTAICGGSAIVALGQELNAEEGDKTVALGTVFLLNTAALYLFPLVGHAMNMSERQFGAWAGIAVHDVSSVVGAAESYGPEALQVATAVKLSRVLWIVPLVFGLKFCLRDRSASNAITGKLAERVSHRGRARTRWPWFIGLFVIATVLRHQFPAIASVAPLLSRAAASGLTLTLFFVGSTISRDTIRAVGWRALLHGTILWLFVSLSSLLVIRAFYRPGS